MSFDDKISLMDIAQKTLEEAAEATIRRMIGKAGEWSLDNELRQKVRERAAEILREPKMTEAIRETLLRWINDPKEKQR